LDREEGGVIRYPIISALATACIAFVGTVAVVQPYVWPHFSWIMSGVDYITGVSRGIAPFIRGGCEDLPARIAGAAYRLFTELGRAALAQS
jgi:hypothetical protein